MPKRWALAARSFSNLAIVAVAASCIFRLFFAALARNDPFFVSYSSGSQDIESLPIPQSHANFHRNDCQSSAIREQTVFNPFVDLQYFPLRQDDKGSRSDRAGIVATSYSSFECTSFGTRNESLQSNKDSYHGRRPHFVSRTCHYRNLYYRPTDQTFHYLASPAEVRLMEHYINNTNETSYTDNMQVSIGHVQDMMSSKVLTQRRVEPWNPAFHSSTDFTSNQTITSLPQDHVMLLYQPFHSMNVGHLVWDDFLSIFSLLDTLGLLVNDDNILVKEKRFVPLFVELTDKTKNYGGMDHQYRCSPRLAKKWNSCVKTYKKFYPALLGIQLDVCSGDILRTGNWLQGPKAIGAWKGQSNNNTCSAKYNNMAPSDLILLPHVMAGTGRLGSFACEGDCALFRGHQLWRYRSFLLNNLLGPQHSSCLLRSSSSQLFAGYITFSLPVGSSRPQEVTFWREEIALARTKYGEDRVKVVDMSKLSLSDQATLMLDTAVLVTNHGGGSFVSIFLRKNTAVLLFWHGPTRFDHNFYEPVGYIRATWISKEERENVNRTMAIIDREMEKTSIVYPNAPKQKHVSY